MTTAGCAPCVQRRAKRLGLVAVRKITPGTTSGAWGTASEGQYAAVPESLLTARPHDFERIPEGSG